jgi:hypothetical protein
LIAFEILNKEMADTVVSPAFAWLGTEGGCIKGATEDIGMREYFSKTARPSLAIRRKLLEKRLQDVRNRLNRLVPADSAYNSYMQREAEIWAGEDYRAQSLRDELKRTIPLQHRLLAKVWKDYLPSRGNHFWLLVIPSEDRRSRLGKGPVPPQLQWTWEDIDVEAVWLHKHDGRADGGEVRGELADVDVDVGYMLLPDLRVWGWQAVNTIGTRMRQEIGFWPLELRYGVLKLWKLSMRRAR